VSWVQVHYVIWAEICAEGWNLVAICEVLRLLIRLVIIRRREVTYAIEFEVLIFPIIVSPCCTSIRYRSVIALIPWVFAFQQVVELKGFRPRVATDRENRRRNGVGPNFLWGSTDSAGSDFDDSSMLGNIALDFYL
jgi:hypothetical protein